jgi:hypothetical protein
MGEVGTGLLSVSGAFTIFLDFVANTVFDLDIGNNMPRS